MVSIGSVRGFILIIFLAISFLEKAVTTGGIRAGVCWKGLSNAALKTDG